MELGWTALAFIIVAAAVAWFWQDSLAARERANAAAIEACERLSLQFLDGTVAFARIAFSRGGSGAITLRRTYVFDYTANSIERRQGFVLLMGQRVESVGYEQEEVQRRPAVTVRPQAQDIPAQPADRANVLSLEDWRARQRQNPGATHQNTPADHDRGQGGHAPSPVSWRNDPPVERSSDHSDRKH
jgi:hypothetical protein